jgi:hypothetical protein
MTPRRELRQSMVLSLRLLRQSLAGADHDRHERPRATRTSGEAGGLVGGREGTRDDVAAFGAIAWRSHLSPRKSVAVVLALLACESGGYITLGDNAPRSVFRDAAGGSAGSGGAGGSTDRVCARTSAKPDATNTGVTAGTPLTQISADQIFSTDGETITGKEFHGMVKVTGSSITFRNCIFRGRASDSDASLLDTRSGSKTWVEDSEFVPSNPSTTIDSLWIADTEICRVHIHGGVDGIKAFHNSVIENSYIHDMSWFASDPAQDGGPTQSDGVQCFASVAHVTLRHNTIDMSSTQDGNAAVQSSATDVHIEENWLDGGGCTLNFDHNSLGAPLTGIYVVNNRFGRNSIFDCPILISTQTTLSDNRGNVWDDTGAPIPAPQQHD